MTYHTLSEILGQPAAWRDALKEFSQQDAALSGFYEYHKPDQLIFMGCGSPFFMARTAAVIARRIIGIDAEAHTGSDVWLFPRETLTPNRKPMMIVISRSGETTEVLKAIESFREETGGEIVAITCYPESPLAKMINPTLLARGGQEIGLAQTRSFTSMLILVQGLINSFADQALSERFRKLPDLCQELIDSKHEFAQQFAQKILTHERAFFLGGGVLYGMACEAMLKFKEMSLSPSEGYHFMEFRHGPMSMINDKALVVGFVSQAAAEYETAVLTEMKAKGAMILAITPVPIPALAADEQVVLPGKLSDLERAPLYLPVPHLITYYHTLQKGLDPDRPHNLTAVIHLDNV